MAAREERLSPIDLAVLAVRWAVREGASEAEAYVVWTRGFRVTAAAGRIETAEAIDDIGVGIRVAVGRRTGFAYATGFEREKVREAIRRAISVAKASREDEYWRGLPSPSDVYPEPESIYEPSLANAGGDIVVEKVREAIDVAKDEGLTLVRASAAVSRIERAIASTSGVYRIDVGTYSWITVALSGEVEGGGRTPAIYEFESSRTVMPSGETVARRAAERVKLCRRRVRIEKPQRMPVVFTASAFSDIFAYTLGFALRGDMVVRGRSPYTGKLGEEVASPKLTIVDDGVLKGGDSTWRFDGEGVAMSRKTLIEKGVLKGFVYDSYWGGRAGVGSTGNAVRAGYSSRPAPGFTNIVVATGDAGLDELLEGEVLVVYQVQGAHSSNPETGEYSVLANPAILYRNGEAVGWAVGVMVSSTMYEDVKERLELVGRFTEHAAPGFYAPWLRFRSLMVAPKA